MQDHPDHDKELWGDTDLKPAPTYEGEKAIYSHVTHSTLGEHIEEGEELIVMFRGCALRCTVDEKITGKPEHD